MSAGSSMTLARAGVLCAAVGFCLYLNSLQGEFVFDDTAAITANDDLLPTTPWSNILWNDYWGTPMTSSRSHKSYRPLTVATFRLNYMLHELQPLGYHLVNVLLHSAVCYLYVLLCGVVFSRVWPALIAGLLFAVHPIHTEAVCGVVGRAELLSAVFFILSFTAYEKSKLHNNMKWLSGSLLMAVASMLCKEQGITVVAVCVAYELLQGFQKSKHSLLKLCDILLTDAGKTPLWLQRCLKRAFIMAVLTVMIVVLRLSHGGHTSTDLFHKNVNPPTALETPYRQLSWLYLTFVNSWLLLNPWNLNVDWRFGGTPLITSLIDPLNLLTLLTFVCVAVLGVWSVCGSGKSHRTAALALSLLILPYLPASNLFFPVGFVVAERILYLPSMGFSMLVGYGAWNLLKISSNLLQKVKSSQPFAISRSWNILVFGLIVYVLVALATKTLLRNPEWQSHIPLFTSGLKLNPRNGLLLANLGKEMRELGDWESAERLMEMGIEASPTHSAAYINLGKIRFQNQRYAEAEEPLRKALELIPVDGNGTTAFITVSYLLAVTMSLDHNVTKLERALQISDDAIRRLASEYTLYIVRSSVLLDLKRPMEALSTVETGLKRNSSCHELHLNMGTAYSQLGERERAKDALRMALSYNPNYLITLRKLGRLCSADNEHKEALPIWERVRELDPNSTEAYSGIATAHFVDKDYEKCEHVLLEGFKLFPNDINILYNLGNLYLRMRKNDLAWHYLELTMEQNPDYSNTRTLLNTALQRLEKEKNTPQN